VATREEIRQQFKKIGLATIRADFVNGGHRFIGAQNRELARDWIAEQEAAKSRTESIRYWTMLILTFIAAVAAVIAAIPTFASWISN
jgi:hypothetical protein